MAQKIEYRKARLIGDETLADRDNPKPELGRITDQSVSIWRSLNTDKLPDESRQANIFSRDLSNSEGGLYKHRQCVVTNIRWHFKEHVTNNKGGDLYCTEAKIF